MMKADVTAPQPVVLVVADDALRFPGRLGRVHIPQLGLDALPAADKLLPVQRESKAGQWGGQFQLLRLFRTAPDLGRC